MASHVWFSDFFVLFVLFVLFVSFVVNRLLAGRKDSAKRVGNRWLDAARMNRGMTVFASVPSFRC
jgi:hypothetical protein